MNKKQKKTMIKEMMMYLDNMSDAYQNLFKWWYKQTFAGIEAAALADSQIEMCFNKAKELYTEDKRRTQ
jgi:hypothetical protein